MKKVLFAICICLSSFSLVNASTLEISNQLGTVVQSSESDEEVLAFEVTAASGQKAYFYTKSCAARFIGVNGGKITGRVYVDSGMVIICLN